MLTQGSLSSCEDFPAPCSSSCVQMAWTTEPCIPMGTRTGWSQHNVLPSHHEELPLGQDT